jgi:hypothetical protein
LQQQFSTFIIGIFPSITTAQQLFTPGQQLITPGQQLITPGQQLITPVQQQLRSDSSQHLASASFRQQQLRNSCSRQYSFNLQQHRLSFNRNCDKKLFTPVNYSKFRSTTTAQQRRFTTVKQ